MNWMERICTDALPAALLVRLKASQACPCSVLALYQRKGFEAARNYMLKLESEDA